MSSYFAFVHSGLESAGNPLIDGGTIAQRCLDKLSKVDGNKQLPPQLLILLASPAYLDSLKSEQLLNGVLDRFDAKGYPDIPLVGCSAAAVFFNQQIFPQGCLLVCLASRLLQARVASAQNVSRNPQESINELLTRLGLIKDKERVHTFVERSLIALFPGFGANKYLAPALHESLREQVEARISIFGGVASANDPERLRSGYLFENRKVYRDAIVAASLEHGTSFGFSLSQGLTDTNKTVNVASLDPEDSRVITSFREGSVKDVMSELLTSSPVPLFADLSMDRDPVVDVPIQKGETVRLTREARELESFHLLKADPKKIRTALTTGVKKSMHRAFLLNPIGALGFRCTGLLRNEEKVGLELEEDIKFVERDLAINDSPFEKSYVGGFVDGEAGLDSNGKSVLSNWANATMVFGDELRFRTPVYRGFEKLTEFAGMSVADNQDEGLGRLTKLVYEIGFPGAMLSLCLFEQDRRAIVPHSASGPRHERLLQKQQPYFINIGDTHDDDVLAIVARSKRPMVILDCSQEKSDSMKEASEEGIISQYVVPLLNYAQQVSAILQIDLGDISYSDDLYETERTALDSLGNVVGAALVRTMIWEESKITNLLDQAMNQLPSEATVEQALQHYFERVIDAFGSKGEVGGHVRLNQKKHSLKLVAGVGSYYEAARDERRNIFTDDPSPTGQAFRSEEPNIVNDAANNSSHLQMCEQWKEKPVLVEALEKVGSFVNIPFRSERAERGTITISTTKPWFFTDVHKRILNIIGQRTAFLLETLRRKEQQRFLMAVSPSFSQIQNLEDISTILKDELENFSRAINAEVASLYIWNEDRQRHILRAQCGWAKPEWLHAAYYENHEFWAGSTALTGTPRHIPDLNVYYEKYRNSVRRHTKDAFAAELSAKDNVEAIALELRIGATRFGVITFYRRRPADARPDDDSGFLITNTKLLQQGADNFSSLVSILEAARHEKWRRGEVKRRQAVHNVTVSAKILHPEKTEAPFEERVCEQLLKSYHGVRVGFYKKVEPPSDEVEYVVGMERDAQTEEVRKWLSPPGKSEMHLVNEVMMANRRGERKLLIERVKISADEERDPQKVALAHLVRRACIPLFSEKQVIGVLDLHWSFDNVRKADTANYQHGEAFLLMLGEMVGEAYAREQAKVINAEIRFQAQQKLNRGKTRLLESVEHSRNAVQATTAYVLQHHHELIHIVTDMKASLMSLRAAIDQANEHEAELLNELSEEIEKGSATLTRMIEIGRKMSTPVFNPHMLEGLIALSLESQLKTYTRIKFDVNVCEFPDEQVVFVDPKLMGIAFDNLIHNALKSMIGRDPRRLTISAVTLPDREIEITIEDTGVGMSEEGIHRVMTEFFSINNKISVGVTIARLILLLHGGRLNYDSVVNDSTRTIVVLPLD